jgi:hypothetical protein
MKMLEVVFCLLSALLYPSYHILCHLSKCNFIIIPNRRISVHF